MANKIRKFLNFIFKDKKLSDEELLKLEGVTKETLDNYNNEEEI